MKAKSAGSSIRINLKCKPGAHSAAMTRRNDLFPASGGEYSMTNYDAETLSSLSTLFRTVGRCIMRSRHAV